ncbi:MAG: NAD(P)-binding domain-containing protein [Frankiales bacterium]|nr:NAD(P)-binding domain-containing protein [Frankiales bacterium]
MRYVVLGAGAVGGTVGGRLADAGHDVVLVARGEHARTMREHGLRLAMPDRTVVVRCPVVDDVGQLSLTDSDVLLLATKTQDTPDLLDRLRAHDGLPLFCLQNGVANERMALRRFERVYGVVVMLPAVLLEPGRIDAQGAPFSGLLDLGLAAGGVDDVATSVAADLDTSGFVSRAVPDVMRWKYAKLLRNVGNAVEALCGHDIDDDGMRIVADIDRRARDEAEAVFAAAGIAWASDAEWVERRGEQVQHAPVEGRSRVGGSSWQSLARGAGSIEADYLNGEVVLLGRLHGVATPVNATLQRLAHRAAQNHTPPGQLTPADLAACLPSQP